MLQVNEEWLSDKSRFATDGLTKQRLDTPLIRYDSVCSLSCHVAAGFTARYCHAVLQQHYSMINTIHKTGVTIPFQAWWGFREDLLGGGTCRA